MKSRNVIMAAALALSASRALADPITIDVTLGSGLATLTAPAGFPGASATSGLLNSGPGDGTGAIQDSGVYSFSTSAAASVGDLGLQFASSVGIGNGVYDFLTADGSAAAAQLSFRYNGAGQEYVTLEDFLAEPGGAQAISPTATEIGFGAQMPGTFADVNFTMDDPAPAPDPTAVPEPATWGVFGVGLLGMAGLARRRGKASVHASAG